jgi:hypothetical protein
MCGDPSSYGRHTKVQDTQLRERAPRRRDLPFTSTEGRGETED